MGERHWTPYQIEIVLHHHCSGGRFPRESAPAYQETVASLVDAGILQVDEDIFRTTPLGIALVEMWCSQPIPVAIYVDPRLSLKEPA